MSATRGQLAYALYNALGITEPSSTDRFSDAGYLAAVTSTLADLGITNGVGGDQFGTYQPTTRGQAFTMIARALGLAGPETSIAEASQALVNAGIVQGYGDERGIGIDLPLEEPHIGLLMDRITPILDQDTGDGSTRRDQLNDVADQARETSLGRQDPRYAAYLANLGVRRGEIDDELALRQDLFNEDQRRRSETYGRMTDKAMEGIGMDFENRGLFRSGTRLGRQAERRAEIGYQQEAEEYAAMRSLQERQRSLERERNALDRELAGERVAAEQRVEEQSLQDRYS